MGEKIVIGPINKGLRTDRTAFVIDNDSFPTLINAYQWRGRIKRKRGTALLGRLERSFTSINWESTNGSGAYTGNLFSSIGLKGNITGATQANPCHITSTKHNLSTGNTIYISGVNGMVQLNSANTYTVTVIDANTFSIGVNSTLYGAYTSGGIWQLSNQLNPSIVPSSITITDGTNTITDNGMGVLTGTPAGSGTILYYSGAITITGAAASQNLIVSFSYYPTLPVMGIEDLLINANSMPTTLSFDTIYSYNVGGVVGSPNIYDVSFYKNPLISSTLPGYSRKMTPTPTTWNGKDYQQFWVTNYQGALWATNGINVPFSITNIGMQFKNITGMSITTASAPAVAVLTIANSGLVAGDFLFINEVVYGSGMGQPTSGESINFQTGYVTLVSGSSVTVEFPNQSLSGTYASGGIAQYLTNRSDPTKDCIRWYDGDPTIGQGLGWVNFMPPLSEGSYIIGDNTSAQYYLVGARIIVPFKDRLLFVGPVIQSSTGTPIYLQDTVIYSQNGTPFYTASFAGDPSLTTTQFYPILTPSNQGSAPSAYWEDFTGYGGFISAGIDQPIVTVSPNEDVLMMGLLTYQVRFVYTGNDISPFNFYITNAELGSSSTFSAITTDRGVISRGSRGFIISSQTSVERIDLEIPDQVFEINLNNNGNERFTAQRDYVNEWIYFSYPSNSSSYNYPNQTLQYNYRDNSWAIFNENYTTYGIYRQTSQMTWANVGNYFPTWAAWTQPWNAGESTAGNPQVLAGNQQGFLILRAIGTGEAHSLAIQNISGGTVTCPNHCLNNGDYITISGLIGASINQIPYQVNSVTTNTFNIGTSGFSGTYIGGGTIQRMYVPQIQTKQFPVAWDMSRKTRIGPQQYLLTTTNNGQITLQIFLSQDGDNAYNAGPIIPSPNSVNDSLIYSNILYTCPESTNLGLTPANVNLQMPSAATQAQIWHRVNTSLIGDTVQLGFTLSDAQMRDPTLTYQFDEIELHSCIIDVSPSQMLA